MTGAWILAGLLPLVGLVSLLAHSRLDPGWTNPRLHFVLFLTVGGLASVLAVVAGDAARRRGDARVLLMSLAFLATGEFMALHAIGTETILFSSDYAGFKVAIPVGLLLASAFAAGSAFVDVRPELAGSVVRRQTLLRRIVIAAMVLWGAWTIAKFPPLEDPGSEAADGSLLAMMAVLGTVVYGAAAVRFWVSFRHRMTLLPASVIGCFVLLTQAMIGVAVTGERSWHASWWEWHVLILLAYAVIGFAASRQWRDERFRPLYLQTTRERTRDMSVLFSDLVGFTTFAERHAPSEVAAMLDAFYAMATPLMVRGFAGKIERLMGDGMLVSFNADVDQPDHPLRAAHAALALQRQADRLASEHDDWPRLRVGVNTGQVVIREMGGDGYVAFELVGDTVNTAARLETQAPVGGVLIGAATYRRLPPGAEAEPRLGLHVKGKDDVVDAHVLRAAGGASVAA
ncbi:MAG: adenylate/guanylate cyclase domain-containing protein [Nocardioidaceae bacterium]